MGTCQGCGDRAAAPEPTGGHSPNGDDLAMPVFGDDAQDGGFSMPPMIPSRSHHDLSPRDCTPRSRASKTPKTPKTPTKTPRSVHTEHVNLEDLDEEDEDDDDDDADLDALELRCVVMEAHFDFYDPISKKGQVMPLIEEVKHHRPIKRPGGVSTPASSSGTPSDAEGHPMEAVTPKTRAQREIEIITRWGVISGKLIFSRVLTLTTMSSMYVVRAQQAKFEKSSRVWTRIEARARRVVNQAALLTKKVMHEKGDLYHADWRLQGGALQELFTVEYIDTLMILAKASAKLLALQPVVGQAHVPCRIFGDLHGQFRDLLLLFGAFGFPGSKEDSEEQEVSYVFNGDFVDRGAHSLEVIGLLLALKVYMPNRVWLVRGNHEDRSMNARYGFLDECQDRLGNNFGRKTYDLMQTAFDQLPLACVVGGHILCVHGGVGDGRWDLNDLRAVRRPLGQQELGSSKFRWVHNILWSDPIEDDRAQRDAERDALRDGGDRGPVFGVHASPRNTTAVLFGWDVTKTFCARNGVDMVVRSHQSKKNGLGFDLMHDECLIRVFSARDYEGHCNDGAVLLVRSGEDEGLQGRPSLSVRAQVVGSYGKAVQRSQAD